MTQQKFYDDYWLKRGKSKGLRLRYLIFLDWLKPGSRVLDVGGGDGYQGEILKNEKNCDVTVLDISEEAVKICQERGVNAVIGDIEKKLPFNDNTFDVVILSDVLEHIIESEEALLEALRVSKNSVFVSFPNTGYIKYRIQLLFGRFPSQKFIHAKEHLRFWTIKDFKEMLNNLNIEIVQIKSSAGKFLLRDLWPSLLAGQLCLELKKSNKQ